MSTYHAVYRERSGWIWARRRGKAGQDWERLCSAESWGCEWYRDAVIDAFEGA